MNEQIKQELTTIIQQYVGKEIWGGSVTASSYHEKIDRLEGELWQFIETQIAEAKREGFAEGAASTVVTSVELEEDKIKWEAVKEFYRWILVQEILSYDADKAMRLMEAYLKSLESDSLSKDGERTTAI